MTVSRTAVVPLLLALSLAACGGSGSSDTTGRSDEEKRLAFADCLRDEGLDVTMSADGRGAAVSAVGRVGGGGSASGDDPMRDVFATCRKRTGWAPTAPSADERAEMRDRALRMARCMRSHGIDMADPAPDGRVTLRVERDSPAMEAAVRACGMGGFGPSGAVPDGATPDAP